MPDAPDSPLPTVVEVLNKLAALGSAPQIADHLIEVDCAGYRGDGGTCPVARYVKGTADTLHGILHIGPDYWSVDNPLTGESISGGNLPIPVSTFIASFDRGGFPGLNARPAPGGTP